MEGIILHAKQHLNHLQNLSWHVTCTRKCWGAIEFIYLNSEVVGFFHILIPLLLSLYF